MTPKAEKVGGLQHVFITVGNRRWCTCCDLFQRGDDGCFPYPRPCPNDALAAPQNRVAMMEMADDAEMMDAAEAPTPPPQGETLP